MSRREIRIAGFGGQGVILSGVIIGKAASIYSGKFAALTQSYGPESRGGSCRAEAVIDDIPIDYPYLVSPDVQIILSQGAYAEYGQSTSSETLLIIDSDLVETDPSKNHKVFSIPASRMAQELGRVGVANIIMLGFLAAKSDMVSHDALMKALLDSVPAGTEELNKNAFELGYNYDIEQRRKD